MEIFCSFINVFIVHQFNAFLLNKILIYFKKMTDYTLLNGSICVNYINYFNDM